MKCMARLQKKSGNGLPNPLFFLTERFWFKQQYGHAFINGGRTEMAYSAVLAIQPFQPHSSLWYQTIHSLLVTVLLPWSCFPFLSLLIYSFTNNEGPRFDDCLVCNIQFHQRSKTHYLIQLIHTVLHLRGKVSPLDSSETRFHCF